MKTLKGESGRVRVSITRKVNLAKYENLDVGVSSEVEIEPGETQAAAIKRVARVVRAEHADILEVVREDQNV